MAFGQHYQNAYVTRNIDKAVESFRQYAGARSILETELDVAPEGQGKGVQKLACA